MYAITNIPIQDLLLEDISSKSNGLLTQHIGRAISCSPLLDNSTFLEAFKFICKDNGINRTDIYQNIGISKSKYHYHINNEILDKMTSIDICIAAGFDFVLTLMLLCIKGITLNPNDDEDYEILEFISTYDGTCEERLNDYLEWLRPEVENKIMEERK